MHGQIEACENWPEGFATPNRRMMYATLNWCQEHHTEIIDTLRTLARRAAAADAGEHRRRRRRRELQRPLRALVGHARRCEAVERYKLYKLAWDLIGSEFAGRHMLYEKFYAGNSIIVRNQSDREAPWEKFHGIVDGLLDGIAARARDGTGE